MIGHFLGKAIAGGLFATALVSGAWMISIVNKTLENVEINPSHMPSSREVWLVQALSLITVACMVIAFVVALET